MKKIKHKNLKHISLILVKKTIVNHIFVSTIKIITEMKTNLRKLAYTILFFTATSLALVSCGGGSTETGGGDSSTEVFDLTKLEGKYDLIEVDGIEYKQREGFGFKLEFKNGEEIITDIFNNKPDVETTTYEIVNDSILLNTSNSPMTRLDSSVITKVGIDYSKIRIKRNTVLKKPVVHIYQKVKE